jgi:ERF superfamily protein
MIRQSETITKLAPAVVAAQAEMTNAPKDTKGQVGNQIRFYTDLPTITDHVRPILAKHGLGYVQFPCNTLTGHVGLTTRLIHASGEWLEDEYSMPAGQGAQGVGSALTYARRYALMALLGIAADDDDGAAASQGQPKAARRPTQAQGGKTVTPAQLTKLGVSFGENGIKDRDARLAYVATIVGHPVESSKDLTTTEAGQVIDALEARRTRLAQPKNEEYPDAS